MPIQTDRLELKIRRRLSADGRPDISEFGEFVSRCLQMRDADGSQVFKNASQVKEVFGFNPGNRSRKQIGDDAKSKMRSFPKRRR